MKNILVFADGTCNESDKGYATNVRKLYQMVERRTKRQLAFYDPGVGTNFYKVTGAAFGVGISKNIQECYEFIVDYYRPGDRIYLFGFSRGAYTVRSLGGMIRKAGLLRREYRKMSAKAFDIYKSKGNDAEAEQFKSSFCWPQTDTSEQQTGVYFIGVWDTVSALGFPLAGVRSLNPFSHRWYGFHNAKLSPDVPYGYQALSIDDQRKIFHPVLWDESEKAEGQTIEQVWFAGVHSNVGGGYRRSGLSDITLQWMVMKALEAGVLLWEDHEKRVLTSPDADGKLYDSRSGLGKIYLKKERTLPENARIHTTVFDRMHNEESLYEPTNLPTRYRLWNDDGVVENPEQQV